MTERLKKQYDDSIRVRQYDGSIDYLLDELKLLDIRIYLEILKQKQTQSAELFEELKGLVVSEREVCSLLGIGLPEEKDKSEINEFERKILRIQKAINIKKNHTLEQDTFLTLPYFSSVFGLSYFEERCIIVAMASELDRKYEKLYAFLQDDINSKKPTIELCLKMFCKDEKERLECRKYFEKDGKLYKYFLEKPDSQESRKAFLSIGLKLDKTVLSLILESWDNGDSEVEYMEVFSGTEDLKPILVNENIHSKLCSFKDSDFDYSKKTLFYLWGRAGSGKKFHVKHYCKYVNKTLIFIDLKQIYDKDRFEEFVTKALVRGRFLQSVICFLNIDVLNEKEEENYNKINFIMREISRYSEEVFMISNKQWKGKNAFKYNLYLEIEVVLPLDSERKKLWETFGETCDFDEDVDLGSISNKFRFSPGQIENALESAKLQANWNSGTKKIYSKDIVKGSYSQVSHNLEKKTTLIHPKYDWEDLILPFEAKSQVRNAVNQIKYRHIVFGEWGFEKKLSYGKGLSMLFAGPPGTGKTMAAQIVANQLDLEIYKIDLSQVISKYIGETEKNLNEIFTEAKSSSAILFFDETDALFGKRSEVKDSHDKYANLETSYLLQKMEEYDGITVLATNYLQNIDEAFIRRISYIIKFPFPDPDFREMLWRTMFPKETPLNPDIDFKYLANKFKIAGGNIKNVIVSASFLAAERNEPVGMTHIVNAAKHELEKNGKVLLREDIMEYYDLIYVE